MAGYFFRYVAPMIAKNLTKKRNILDDMIKSRDKQLSGVRDEAKVEIKSKNPLSKFTKKIEKIVDKKATGGRVGRMGGGMMGRRFGMKKGSKFPDFSGDGKTTMKDILMARGVIPKPKDKKKKMIAKKSETPMDKAIKKKNNRS